MKTLLNNKKPPPPPSTTSLHSILSSKTLTNEIKPAAKAQNENYLLDNLVSHLHLHTKKKQTAPVSKSMQFNNYKTDVDGYSNFGLNLASTTSTSTDYGFTRSKTDESLISTLNNRTNLSSLELSSGTGAAMNEKKTSSSSSSSSSSSGDYNKPGNINR